MGDKLDGREARIIRELKAAEFQSLEARDSIALPQKLISGGRVSRVRVTSWIVLVFGPNLASVAQVG